MEENNENQGTENNENMQQAGVSEATGATQTAEAPVAGEGKRLFPNQNMEFLNDMSVALTIEVGRTQIKIRELLNLSKDSIIELNKGAGEPVDIYANGKLISRGNIITANGKYCVRLTTIAQPETEKA